MQRGVGEHQVRVLRDDLLEGRLFGAADVGKRRDLGGDSRGRGAGDSGAAGRVEQLDGGRAGRDDALRRCLDGHFPAEHVGDGERVRARGLGGSLRRGAAGRRRRGCGWAGLGVVLVVTARRDEGGRGDEERQQHEHTSKH
jgi:hypothetical protein